jgi:hypothetical protein
LLVWQVAQHNLHHASGSIGVAAAEDALPWLRLWLFAAAQVPMAVNATTAANIRVMILSMGLPSLAEKLPAGQLPDYVRGHMLLLARSITKPYDAHHRSQ